MVKHSPGTPLLKTASAGDAIYGQYVKDITLYKPFPAPKSKIFAMITGVTEKTEDRHGKRGTNPHTCEVVV